MESKSDKHEEEINRPKNNSNGIDIRDTRTKENEMDHDEYYDCNERDKIESQ